MDEEKDLTFTWCYKQGEFTNIPVDGFVINVISRTWIEKHPSATDYISGMQMLDMVEYIKNELKKNEHIYSKSKIKRSK